jgi:hypothetical protein
MNVMLETDLSNFSRGMAGFVDRLGLQGPVVLRKETGELAKTLIRLTPPRRQADTNKKISRDYHSRFDAIGKIEDKPEYGAGGIIWGRHSKAYLEAYAPGVYQPDLSVKELTLLRYQIQLNRRGAASQIIDFKHPRKSQKVRFHRRITVLNSTIEKAISAARKKVGRLKAGWLVGYDRLRPGGGNQPPAWVTRHRTGARGWFIDAAATKNFPSFTIANTAAGVGNPRNDLTGIVRAAIGLRVKAMKTNLALLVSGKKNLSDYARP